MASRTLDLVQTNAKDLAALGVRGTATELILPPGLPVETWLLVMRGLGSIVQASAFWVGDGLLGGEEAYGEMYSQAEAELGLSEQTLTNYVYTCRHVLPDMRRPELSFGHHSAVASLDRDQQAHYLGLAVENGWSRADLREAIKDAGLARNRTPAQPTPGHAIAVAAVDAAAREAGTVRPVAEAVAALVPQLTAVEDAARVVYGAAMEVSDVPPQLAGTYKAVPTAMLAQLGAVLASVDEAASGAASAAATGNGGAPMDSLVPIDDYPCTNVPPCAYVATTEEELWAHLREEHGWQ